MKIMVKIILIKNRIRWNWIDPYGSSKGCCELLISSYRRSFNNEDSPMLASVRAGNVIGGGDWSKDRLIPDILKAFEKSKTVIIRNPNQLDLGSMC